MRDANYLWKEGCKLYFDDMVLTEYRYCSEKWLSRFQLLDHREKCCQGKLTQMNLRFSCS